jgi:FkbH-like protein
MNQTNIFFDLKKNLKKDFRGFKYLKIAIIGDSSTQFLRQAIRGSGFNSALDLEIYEADYDQIDQEILDETSYLYEFKPDYILIFQNTQKIRKKFYFSKENTRHNFAELQIAHLNNLIETIVNKLNARIIYANFIEINDGVFGNFGNKVDSSFLFQLRKLNYELMKLAVQRKNFFINDLSSLNNQWGLKISFDAKMYVNASITQSLDFTAIVAENTLGIIRSLIGKIKKCIILDLDNTTWGGIIGDDGMEKIQIGELGIGRAFSELQQWVKELKRRGIIVAVCSKNTDSIAREPFEKHPDMVLRMEDISVFVANWETKVDNIRYIQSILNIGFDSMVFIDDNPFEREIVRSEIHDIEVPELPVDPSLYLQFLTGLNLFETASFSTEDGERTKQYQEEAKRSSVKKSFSSEHDYLKSLSMKSHVKAFDNFTVPRIAQLTQRSNQFNLRTKRYTEQDIVLFIESEGYTTLSFTLEDKFGDNGLIAAVILEEKNDTLLIDTWIMSCRVLKRGMEQFIINEIVKIAQAKGINKLVGEYLPTQKNLIVKDLYESLGFLNDNALWILDVNQFTQLKNFINAEY